MNHIIEHILNGVLRSSINNPHITDKIFLEIERSFMRQYRNAISRNSCINMQIGKYIKQYLKLRNTGRNRHPKSKLIKSYTVH